MLRPRRIDPVRGGRIHPKENSYYPQYPDDLEKTRVYLNSREYFNVEFPKLVRHRWSESKAFDETNNDSIIDDKSFENTMMFKTMAAVWVATWECGVSQEDMEMPGIFGAIYRFHVYYTVRRILRSRGRLSFYILDNTVRQNVWKYIPTKYEIYDINTRECKRSCKLIEISDKDFLHMVAPTSNGLTDLGVSLLQESVMTYVYALLAAQTVNPGKNITGGDGVAKMVQKSFLEKVEDRIRVDNGVDNIMELYKETSQRSTATGVIVFHDKITMVTSNLKINPAVTPSVSKSYVNTPLRKMVRGKTNTVRGD